MKKPSAPVWVKCPKSHVNFYTSYIDNGNRCPQCGSPYITPEPPPHFGPVTRKAGKR